MTQRAPVYLEKMYLKRDFVQYILFANYEIKNAVTINSHIKSTQHGRLAQLFTFDLFRFRQERMGVCNLHV